jgi:hypothetical protein
METNTGENQPLLGSGEGRPKPLRASKCSLAKHEDDVVSFTDSQFGGPEERKRLERGLLRKLDRRMSILILIQILNCAFDLYSTEVLWLNFQCFIVVDRNNASCVVHLRNRHRKGIEPCYIVLHD